MFNALDLIRNYEDSQSERESRRTLAELAQRKFMAEQELQPGRMEEQRLSNLAKNMAIQNYGPELQRKQQAKAQAMQLKRDALAAQERIAGSRRLGGAPIAVMGPDGRPMYVAPDKALGMQPWNKKEDAARLPTSALKLQQEELDAISAASSLNADLGAVAGQVGTGGLKLGPVENIASKAKNWAGMSDQNSRNFASFNATLERLRNESLRLNKGVQTEGDAQRAWNELLSNINDPAVVSQRLSEIQKLNERAANTRKMNIDSIRSNFGAEPLDTSRFERQPPALGGNPSPTSAAANPQDAAAIEWAKANPNDPRAAEIKRRLGVR